MPVSIDIHENTYLEEIYQDGREEGIEEGIEKGIEKGTAAARAILRTVIEQRFGRLSPEYGARLQTMKLEDLERMTARLGSATGLDEIFG